MTRLSSVSNHVFHNFIRLACTGVSFTVSCAETLSTKFRHCTKLRTQPYCTIANVYTKSTGGCAVRRRVFEQNIKREMAAKRARLSCDRWEHTLWKLHSLTRGMSTGQLPSIVHFHEANARVAYTTNTGLDKYCTFSWNKDWSSSQRVPYNVCIVYTWYHDTRVVNNIAPSRTHRYSADTCAQHFAFSSPTLSTHGKSSNCAVQNFSATDFLINAWSAKCLQQTTPSHLNLIFYIQKIIHTCYTNIAKTVNQWWGGHRGSTNHVFRPSTHLIFHKIF